MNSNPSFVLVFIGNLRGYMIDTIHQIRLWNPSTPIYLCVTDSEQNKFIIEKFKTYNTIIVYLHDLVSTLYHQQFQQSYNGDQFLKCTMERFFYLEECMRQYSLTNVVHIEFDNTIYFHIEELLSYCDGSKLLIPSDNDSRFIAGICIVPNTDLLSVLNHFFTENHENSYEMVIMMNFYKKRPDIVEALPVIPPEYTGPYKPLDGIHVSNPERLYTVSPYNGLFDAAALGQYLGGIDPKNNPNNTEGYISPDSSFQVNRLWFKWVVIKNLYQLRVSADKDNWYTVYNLHIHNKNLTRWMSDREKPANLPNVSIPTLLSGEVFQTLCDVTWITQDKKDFHSSLPSSIHCLYFDKNCNPDDGTILFVYIDELTLFIDTILPSRTRPFVLVTHNGDYGITSKYLTLLAHPLLIRMYSQNIEIEHPKLFPIPIGIANSMWPHGNPSNLLGLLNGPKQTLVYVNMNTHTYPSHRTIVQSCLSRYPFTKISPGSLDHRSYIRELSTFKWVASPRGNGVDIHRMWEALYVDSIPLVDDSISTRAFKSMGLPIILIEDWSIISLEWLEEQSKDLVWDKKHMLYTDYWMDQFTLTIPPCTC